MRVKLIDIDMYNRYVVGQLQLSPGDDEKQLQWLFAEDRKLTREATQLSQENPDQATDILLTFLSRLTHIRQLSENIRKAPLFA